MGSTYIDRFARAIHDEIAPDKLPDAETTLLFRLYAVLALAKGAGVTLEDVHDAWAAWMAGIDPGHRSLRPFRELSDDVRLQDQPYVDAIHRVAARTHPTKEAAWS